jgi:hypothetical protein
MNNNNNSNFISNINNNPRNINFQSGINSDNKPYIIIDNLEDNYIDKKTNTNNGIDYDKKLGILSTKEPHGSNKYNMTGYGSHDQNNIKNYNDINKFSFGNFTNSLNPSKNSYVKIHKKTFSNTSNRINSNDTNTNIANNFKNHISYSIKGF